LGEFSPVGRLFTLDSLLKIFKKEPKLFVTFKRGKNVCINFAKTWIELHFGRIFHQLVWPAWHTQIKQVIASQ
jgi:hypothetical protein